MVVTTITAFEGNFGDDRNTQSIVAAIADLTTSFTNEHIAEAGLNELNALNVKTSAITAFLLDLGRKFEDIKKSLKPKEKFRDLVEAMGRTVTSVNKLIRAAKVANNFPAQTAYMLGIDMLAQLAQSKYADLIDDFVEHPPQSQLEASFRMKEWKDSQPKKPKTPWKYVGAHKTRDGLPREYQAPIVSETAGLIIEQESENAGMPPRTFIEQAVQAQSLRERVLSPASFAFVEPKALSEELKVVAASAENHKAEVEELKATITKLELEKNSDQTTLAQVLEYAVALPLNLIHTLLPLSLSIKSAPFESPVRELVPLSAARKPKSEKFFAIGEMVMYCGVIYRVESEPDADGNVECMMANGRSRVLAMQFLKKCEVS